MYLYMSGVGHVRNGQGYRLILVSSFNCAGYWILETKHYDKIPFSLKPLIVLTRRDIEVSIPPCFFAIGEVFPRVLSGLD